MDRYHALLDAELDAFIAEHTTPDRDARVAASDMYSAYEAWSKARPSPVPPMSNTMFGLLASRKLMRLRASRGQFYLGVRLTG